MKEYLIIFKKLELAYNKEFDNEIINFFIDNLKDINIEVLKETINKIIKEEKYMPSIAKIIEKCNDTKKNNFIKIIELMKQDNYFSNANEIDKILMWYEKGIIPSWFKEDMQKYKIAVLENKPLQLEERK